MPYEAQSIEIQSMALSANKQNAYGTVLPDINLTYRPSMDGGIFASFSQDYRGNSQRTNKGHMWPTQFQEIMREWGINASLPLDDFLAGWLMAFIMGSKVTTGAGPFTHTFSFDTSTNIAPVTSIFFQDTADVKYKTPDLAMVEVTIAGGPTGEVTVSFSMVGSGRHTDAPAFAVPAAPAAPVYLLSSDTDILLGAQGGAATIKERVRSWQVKLSSGITQHRGCGGGLYSTMVKWGLQRATVQLAVAAKDTDDIRTLKVNTTLRELQININSGAAAQLNMKFPGLYLTAMQNNVDGNEIIFNLESDDRGVIKSGGNEIFTAVAINSQANYLVGA